MTYVEISLFSKSDRFIWGINQWMIWVLWPSSFSLEVIVTVKQCWNLLEGIPFFFEISTRQWIENPQLTRRLIIYFKVVPNFSRYNKKNIRKVLTCRYRLPCFYINVTSFAIIGRVNLMGCRVPYLFSNAGLFTYVCCFK